MPNSKRLLISGVVLVGVWLGLSAISSQASSIQGDVIFGGSALSTPGAVPYVRVPGALTQDPANLFYIPSNNRLVAFSHATYVAGVAKMLMQTNGYALSSDSCFSWKDQVNLDSAGTFDVGMCRQSGSTLELVNTSSGGFSNLIVQETNVTRSDTHAVSWVQTSPSGNYQLFSIAAGAFRFDMNAAGQIQVSGYGAGALTTDASGNITAVSDERLKYVRRPFTRGLREIAELRPIVYKWRPESGLETKHEYAGFSAQQVRPFIPEAIGQDPAGHLTLQDRPIEAALVNAVQELSAQVNSLQKQVNELKHVSR